MTPDYSILLKARNYELDHELITLHFHDSKMIEEKFSPPPEFVLRSPTTVSQHVTNELRCSLKEESRVKKKLQFA